VDTPGGRYYAEIDDDAPVTREGQWIFFAQFLHSGGRWERLVRNCPLRYHGTRGSGALNVLGTASLSILCGHWRYANINSVRGDTLNPPLLGQYVDASVRLLRGLCSAVAPPQFEQMCFNAPVLHFSQPTALWDDVLVVVDRQSLPALWQGREQRGIYAVSLSSGC
jgi:hypothetical protein